MASDSSAAIASNLRDPNDNHPDDRAAARHLTHRLARLVLLAFLFTFIVARILVYLIMTRRMPDLFLHVGQTHVHHLNYGIFILSALGAYLIFARPGGSPLFAAAVLYGIGLALTFDEFGMWIHLGGSYWQRASYDAVVVIAAFLGLIAYAPAIRKFQTLHWFTAVALALALLAFAAMLFVSVRAYGRRVAPRLQEIEQNGPQ